MKAHLEKIVKLLVEGNESTAVVELDLFIETHGAEAFQNTPIEIFLSLSDGAKIQASLFWYAALNNYLQLAQRLIDLKVDLDPGTRSVHHPCYDNQSPLMAACEGGYIEMVSLLLTAGANSMHLSSTGLSLLWKARDAEVCKLIVEHAKQQHTHLELMAVRADSGYTAFQYALATDKSDVVNTILSYEMMALQQGFMHSEAQALSSLERFVSLYPATLLDDNIFHFQDDSSTTPLYYAAKNNYIDVASRLLALGVPVDKGIKCDNSAEEKLHLASPLIIACFRGHIDMLRLLLVSHANILHKTASGFTALMLAKTVEIVRLLLAESQAMGLLNTLLSMKSYEDSDAGPYLCKQHNSDAIRALMEIPDFHSMLDMQQLLRAARLASAVSTEKSAEFDKICKDLKPLQPAIPPVAFASQPMPSTSLSGSSFSLFHHDKTIFDSQSFEEAKADAIQLAITRYYDLLCNPHDCMVYLQCLNEELQRYYQVKFQSEFPVLDRTGYDFKRIGDLYYPVPNSNYSGIKKHRALSELLIAIFRKYGLAEHAVKWIGFILEDIADDTVRKGHFFTEGTYGVGLLHGKLSHMIQRLLLIFAVEDGRLNLSFNHHTKRYMLEYKDILEGLVAVDINQKKYWTRVQDSRNFNEIQFSDPHRLTSVIMLEGHANGLPALADSLIDSFCKGFKGYFQHYQQYTPFSDIELAQFISHLEDLTLHLFSLNLTLIRVEKEETIQKRGCDRSSVIQAPDYALIPKIYTPNPAFEPRTGFR